MIVSLSKQGSKKAANEKKLQHKPVMEDEVIQYLKPDCGDIILDCTIGTGGHARKIMERVLPDGRLIGIDQDEESLMIAHGNLSKFEDNITLIKENFQNIVKVLSEINVHKIDGVLFDLGISWFQISNPDRGFSFKHNGPLDMRMDRNKKISAFDLINNLSGEEISNIIKRFGQERWHRRIARAIVKERRKQPIHTTNQLAELVKRTVPPSQRYKSIHPATRTFQAFRIAVNRELVSLEKGLSDLIEFLNPWARICVISFHSLEDRIVKNLFKKYARLEKLNILTKKPLTPSRKEIKKNPKSRSAKFRAAEKINEA